MKILNLKIKNGEEIIREMKYLENGVFYVFGNITQPKDTKKTSNSIGKTLALKMCDYVFGCKDDAKLRKTEIKDYHIVAEVLHNNKIHVVERALGSPKTFFLDGREIKLSDYCDFFGIRRNLYSRFIRLNPKGSLLGYNKTEIKSDYVDFLLLLNLKELSKMIDEYYELRTKIENIEKAKKELMALIDIKDNKLSEKIFINEKKIDEISENIAQTNKSILTLEIGEDTAQLQKKYEHINDELKKIQIEISKLTLENAILKKFVDESNNNNISTLSIKKMYEKVQYQVPDMVYKKLEEVELFYESVIKDRINNINNRFCEIKRSLENNENLKRQYIEELDSIGRKIANDGIYQSALNVINENTAIFSELKYEQGKLYQIKELSDDASLASSDISTKHNDIEKVIGNNEELLEKYRNFIYNLVQDIYDKEVTAYFSVYTPDYKKNSLPIHVDLNISGETGEGISEVKKNVIDILLFKFSTASDVLILDSSCFNGIDPRQVSGLLVAIENICLKNNKQAIISINKYQITSDYLKSYIKEDNCLSLSEDDKLLRKSF